MTPKQLTLILLLLILGACILVTLPVAYIAYQNYQSYQTDLNTLTSIATRLGYTPERQLNLYEVSSQTYHNLKLVFYTTDSLDQFSAKISSSRLNQEMFFQNVASSSIGTYFLEQNVNERLSNGIITLNGYYKHTDIEAKNLTPIISNWILLDPETKKTVTIYYACPTGAPDKWLRDGKLLEGNIVVISINRR